MHEEPKKSRDLKQESAEIPRNRIFTTKIDNTTHQLYILSQAQFDLLNSKNPKGPDRIAKQALKAKIALYSGVKVNDEFYCGTQEDRGFSPENYKNLN